MTDIVERLRARADAHHHGDRIGSGNLMDEAADEIERLRKALSEYGDHTYECDFKEHLGRCTCGYSNALGVE